jgi:DNA-binding transcriptional ArsR family regulator
MTERHIKQMRKAAGEVSDFLKALGNENRLLVLCILLDGEKNVSDINAEIDLSPSALSQHLAWLREAGLVKTRRVSQTIFYQLADKRVIEILMVLKKLFCN